MRVGSGETAGTQAGPSPTWGTLGAGERPQGNFSFLGLAFGCRQKCEWFPLPSARSGQSWWARGGAQGCRGSAVCKASVRSVVLLFCLPGIGGCSSNVGRALALRADRPGSHPAPRRVPRALLGATPEHRTGVRPEHCQDDPKPGRAGRRARPHVYFRN